MLIIIKLYVGISYHVKSNNRKRLLLFWAFLIYLLGVTLIVSLIRIGVFSYLGAGLTLLVLNVVGGEVIPLPGPSGSPNSIGSGPQVDIDPSGPSNSSARRWQSFEERVLMEPFLTSESGTGERSINQGLPANAGASGGEEAGPSNHVPYPYQPDEMIGGDSIDSIHRRFLSKYSFPSYEEIKFSRYDAEDLFEVKVDIIKAMAGLDPTGDWMGRGARALDNPRTATGEPSLNELYARLEDLTRSGIQSDTFLDLKSRMLSERAGDEDENSVT